MKLKILILSLVIFPLSLVVRSQPFNYDQAWEKIEKLESVGLTASARHINDSIYTNAYQTNNYPQFLKSFIFRMKYRSILEDTDFSRNMMDAEHMLDSVAFPVKPVLHSMVAEMYWWYYQNNRYKFYNRSKMAQFVPGDIATWDLSMLAKKVIFHYRNSLNDSSRLIHIPMNDFREIILSPYYTISKLIHPSLYDFLTLRAIKFFQDDDSGLTLPGDEFSIDNDTYFQPADSFARLHIDTPDSMAFKFHVVTLYHDLINAHLNDSTPESLIDIDIQRLNFIYANSLSLSRDSLYLQRLKSLEIKCRGRYMAGTIGLLIAQKYMSMGDGYTVLIPDKNRWYKKTGLEKCMDVIQHYPERAEEANELIATIRQKNISVTLEHENIPNEPFRALLGFQNTDTLFVRIIPTTYVIVQSLHEQYQNQNKNGLISWNQFMVNYLRNHKSSLQYHLVLPNSHDFQKHFTEIKVPGLDPGYYYILASTDSAMVAQENAVAFGITAITNLSYIHRHNKDGSNDFYILNRKSGEPVAGVKAECWYTRYNYSKRDNETTLFSTHESDINGFFRVNHLENESYWVDFSYKSEHWSSRDVENLYYNPTFSNYHAQETSNKAFRTFFFTDRSIYRPGQTIYFKGIVLNSDGNKFNELLTDFKSTINFMDVNNQKISGLDLTTNEYGSFNGSFVAPKTGLNGVMTINNSFGSVTISVEDYKRPTFEIQVDSLSSGYKLGETVTVPGSVAAYSGAKVDGATVTYRVVRNTRYVGWRNWWSPQPVSPAKELVHGKYTTDGDGKFKIQFKAIADATIAPSTNPAFTYTIYADVTDMNGETHSVQKNVTIGYTSLILDVSMPERLERNGLNKYTLQSKNLDGDHVPSSGQVIILRLKSPDHVFRERKWAKPDVYTMSKEDYYKTFKNDQYSNELDFTSWETDKTILEKNFEIPQSPQLALENLKNWKTGVYLLILNSKDSYGVEVTQKRYFTVYDKNVTSLPYAQTDWIDVPKNYGEPGDTIALLCGTGYDNTRVLLELETQDGIIHQDWVRLNHGQQLFPYVLTESYRGNIGIHCTFIRNNRLYSHSMLITVPYTNKMLDIDFGTFRNKLQPNEKEQWQLHIKGKNGDKVAAEMVATLYDASLDVFNNHSFNFNLWPSFNPQIVWRSGNCFDIQQLQIFKQTSYRNITFFYPNYYSLNWFDFGFNRSYRFFRPGKSDVTYNSAYILISTTKQKGSDVTGKVIDIATGEPLIGVNIILEGTTVGTLSDSNGNFKIHSSSDNITLIISYIGYESGRINLVKKGKVNVKVSLIPDIQNLNEVVVVGYGTQKKSTLTGAVSEDKLRIRGYVSDSEAEMSPPAPEVNLPVQPDLSSIHARTNLNETAFFYPRLQTNADGEIIINFTIPEALTRWKMLGFAHTRDLSYGFAEKEVVTQKTLMVTPNVPRFFREGDTLTLTSKITSLADSQLSGNAQLMLFDGLTMKPMDISLHNTQPQQAFTVPKQGSVNLNWNIIIPVGLQAVTYRVVAKAGDFSDGEESTLPVLSNSLLVTETLPLPIRGHQTKTYTLDKLVSNTSTTLRNHKLTLEFTSNPAWYAIQALPYLMEYPYECAEQTFSRFYANSIATHIVNSSPRIKQVFDSWKNSGPDALLSNLEKNQELKSLLLEETPWVINAQNEQERKNRVALLFDLNTMSDELNRALVKLEKTQVSNGGWPWFAGMPDDRYITQHIICGMGKLDHLGIKNIHTDTQIWTMVSRAVVYADQRVLEDYQALKKLAAAGKLKMNDNHTGYTQIHYLYARSFFQDITMNTSIKEAVTYYLNQARTYWLTNNGYMQGMIALTANRFNGADKVPAKIIHSLKEHAIHSDEMGMYWKQDQGWFWYQAPIESQAMMIEAFDEVANDSSAVEDMKIWLLKQKQTQDWKTTRATTEACYALLLRGTNLLDDSEPVSITVGKHVVDPAIMPDVKVEAGTGYFKTSWPGNDITPDMGKVTLTKKNAGVSWGALYWQYFEQLDKITGAETPLKMKKQLFVERVGDGGPVIIPLSDTTHLHPGDLIRVRIELRVDRTMEYVHMKDMRASGLEPVNVISQYKYQDGLGYYETTRDAATNFFFSWLPKGTHVFEYSLRVTHYGNFSNGIGTIQCMYAPEFTGHSEGVRLHVKIR